MKYYDLETIKSEQEVFNIVALHLLTQNYKSMNISGNQSLYRDYQRGLQCAAGIFISDADYIQMGHFEEKSWRYLVDHGMVSDKHSELITRLQDIHDIFSPREWFTKLQELAVERQLDSRVLNEKANSQFLTMKKPSLVMFPLLKYFQVRARVINLP